MKVTHKRKLDRTNGSECDWMDTTAHTESKKSIELEGTVGIRRVMAHTGLRSIRFLRCYGKLFKRAMTDNYWPMMTRDGLVYVRNLMPWLHVK